ncbi:MAG: hypothetical protein EHM12_07955 [Dehalococcoidia bacterium]|nr:MAG: hypothetical protein EHM12_07955 [Dehalococcoidia bacterium]
MEKHQITFEASVGFLNKYIFRGYELSKNSMVIQPSVAASFKGFEASIWGNMDTNQHKTQSLDPGNSEGKGRYNETEYTLSYTFKADKLGLTGGFTHYDFKYWDNTDELFISATYNILTKPTLSIYRDVNAYPGTYINLSFAHSFNIIKKATLDLGASGGYYAGSGNCWQTYDQSTGAFTGPKYNALHDGMVKAGLTIPLSKNLIVRPIVEYWFPLSGKAGKTMGYNAANEKISYNPDGYIGYNVVAGVNVTYGF